ncbi:MAG: prolyl oligopeptidase family serine peptidase [Chryseobacterium sp.]|nr:prolyl oligopeptidase family serine peptidase [Chryseobacterium sp.]
MMKSQQSTAELDRWMSSFSSSLHTLKVSNDERFAVVTKSYAQNSDTLLVFDGKMLHHPYDTIVGKTNTSFLSNNLLFAWGISEASLIDLKAKKRLNFKDLRRSEILKGLDQFVLLSRHGGIGIYDYKGKSRFEASEVDNFVTDGKDILYVLFKRGASYELVKWDGKRMNTIYLNNKKGNKIELVSCGKFICIVAHCSKEESSTEYDFTLVRMVDGLTYKNVSVRADSGGAIEITESKNDEVFLIDIYKRVRPKKDNSLEVWYGSDGRLHDKKNGYLQHDYHLWNISNGELSALGNDHSFVFVGMNDCRYLWMYNTEEQCSYTAGRSATIYRYDTITKGSVLVFDRADEMVTDVDSRFTLAYSEISKSWQLYDHSNNFLRRLNLDHSYTNPIFISDGSVLFEKGDSIYTYHLRSGVSTCIKIEDETSISFYKIGSTNIHHSESLTIVARNFDAKEPLLLHLKRARGNNNGYFSYHRGKLSQILPYTQHRIKEFAYHLNHKKVYSVEENFNLASSLFATALDGKDKRLVYGTNLHDKAILQAKQEIFSYVNSVGVPLKGVLYYPILFNAKETYPMVVHIYQVQHQKATHYLTPEWGENGFNIRMLLEKGYFVFQPDIVFDQRGTGFSALDCVHAGLDVVTKNPFIDQSKIGLTGHSLGGYEVNFIATHSDRFATYISGSSVSDIVNFYFSFNEMHKIADYSRFETGQFAIGKPYSDAKDLYFSNNPINFVENVRVPILLWAGKRDTNVPSSQTMSFYMGLLRNNKRVIALFYTDQQHSFTKKSKDIKDLTLKIIEWWNYFLKGDKSILWISKEMK